MAIEALALPLVPLPPVPGPRQRNGAAGDQSAVAGAGAGADFLRGDVRQRGRPPARPGTSPGVGSPDSCRPLSLTQRRTVRAVMSGHEGYVPPPDAEESARGFDLSFNSWYPLIISFNPPVPAPYSSDGRPRFRTKGTLSLLSLSSLWCLPFPALRLCSYELCCRRLTGPIGASGRCEVREGTKI